MPKKSTRSTANKPAAKKPRTATKTPRRKSRASTPKPKAPAKSPTRKSKTASLKSAVRRANVFPRESGPRKWVLPTMESGYTRLVSREQYEADAAARGTGTTRSGGARATAPTMSRSTLRPDRGATVLAEVGQNLWLDRLATYRQRKAGELHPMRMRGAALPPGAAIPGQKNWAPLGPSVVMNGQAHGEPPVGGRVGGIAVARGGQQVYAASANGGVFRSDDGGVSWRSLMDAFDVDPTDFASTSLACGAIAIDLDNPDRVFVGSGEGDTYAIFKSRITNALPAYRGIGPIRSDDGGATWITEATAADSPALAGKAFFALALDPRNPENVVGATTEGLYQRTIGADGTPLWTLRRANVHSSVVVAATPAATRFICAEWGKGVFESPDGTTFTAVGTGFPSGDIGRIALAVQPTNISLVYAMVAKGNGVLAGIYRIDSAQGEWKKVTNAPDVLPVDNGSSQGDYDLTIAVDPADANLIYIGGSYFSDHMYWPASIWRCEVKKSGSAYRMTGVSIGTHAHADVHTLVHTPGNSDALWTGCDGGVFLNRAPRGSGAFASCNNGLACLCTNFFAQHPTDPAILFCGLQDNGTARTGGGGVWKNVNGGDGGYCLINWSDPNKVLVFANGTISRATDGGQGPSSWTDTKFPWGMMTEPIVGTPYDPAHAATGGLAAVATGSDVHVSTDFGATWGTTVPVSTNGGVFALTFASGTMFYAGTTSGEVFRFTKTGSAWVEKRIDNVAAGALGLHGIIADIAVDWSDATGDSIYVAFGGIGDFRHVWHFDGTRWKAASGASSTTNGLLDVEHNAIVVDRLLPDHVYVGADIGAWHSPDRGQTWKPMPNGLPDAPVFDLQIHPTQRLLRATTHGRGMFEYALDPAP